ncbi:hypothetical protein PMIN06_010132 [Paraphaeosphaeria minitans]|uniref:BZIP transcription factor n=1 Tax=Paraphaeosphaeria minitans TaxID=565426 RepID=A0A9P6KMQ9_9PLEO|nr:bZIP transcription factor [Paraphaeosphaeria minitans]
MEVETNMHHAFAEPSWATDAYLALDNGAVSSSDKWAAALTHAPSFSQSTFTIPPSLLTAAAAVERYGQVTPPEDLSPAEPPREPLREGSLSLEELQNEPLFPQHQMQALQDYQPRAAQDEPASKRRRISRQSSTKNLAVPQTQQPQQDGQPPKRKRGRPKSTPQMVEHYTADGFPFHVSSARQSHLEKNRVAAHKCRQRKKEYVNGLEARARDFSSKNKALKENVAMLREEVLSLKNEVLRHAGCGFWAVDEYLARCAGDLLGVDAPGMSDQRSNRPKPSPMTSSSSLQPDHVHRRSSGSILSVVSSPDHDDYSGLDFLHNIDEDEEDQSA